MATFVLVHGAWHGAWCWRRVARLLAGNGHEVFAPTLTGLGERSHLLTPVINVDTHILDVVNEMKWQQLNDVVLVGHSYGGVVISGVAEKMEKSIAVVRHARRLHAGKRPIRGRHAAAGTARGDAGGGTLRRDNPAAAAAPSSSRSTKRTAPGSMRNARRNRSSASCRN